MDTEHDVKPIKTLYNCQDCDFVCDSTELLHVHINLNHTHDPGDITQQEIKSEPKKGPHSFGPVQN